MIKAILIDDEISSLETLKIELEAYCPQVEVIATCESPEDGLQAVQTQNPDLVFLDIEMPNMNAFEFLEKVGKLSFDIIFVTGYDRYAIHAFEVNAVDYLLKPVQKTKLISAVEKVEQKQDRGIDERDLKEIKDLLKSRHMTYPNIALPTLEGYEFVKIDAISYARADSNYTRIILANGKQLILSKTLKEIEAMLSEHHFVRVHQSFLINLSHIVKYVKGSGGYAVMSNGETINVSRSYKKRLIEILKGN